MDHIPDIPQPLSPGPVRVGQHYSSNSLRLAVSTDRGFNSESRYCRGCYPRSKYAGKEAGAGPGGWKELIEGNIGD